MPMVDSCVRWHIEIDRLFAWVDFFSKRRFETIVRAKCTGGGQLRLLVVKPAWAQSTKEEFECFTSVLTAVRSVSWPLHFEWRAQNERHRIWTSGSICQVKSHWHSLHIKFVDCIVGPGSKKTLEQCRFLRKRWCGNLAEIGIYRCFKWCFEVLGGSLQFSWLKNGEKVWTCKALQAQLVKTMWPSVAAETAHGNN